MAIHRHKYSIPPIGYGDICINNVKVTYYLLNKKRRRVMSRPTFQKVICYVIPFDSGFAPNPFHGICTLATCKPKVRLSAARTILASYNQSGMFGPKEAFAYQMAMPNSDFIRSQGLWIIGIAGKDICNQIHQGSRGRLLYFMQITDIMTYSEYWYNHPEKRPTALRANYIFNATPSESDFEPVGDNIYPGDLETPLYSVHYVQGKEKTPDTINQISKDRSGIYILLSDNFAYFGSKAIEDPLGFPLATTQGHTVYERGIDKKHPHMPFDDDVLLERLEEALSHQFDLAHLPGRIGFPAEDRKYRGFNS